MGYDYLIELVSNYYSVVFRCIADFKKGISDKSISYSVEKIPYVIVVFVILFFAVCNTESEGKFLICTVQEQAQHAHLYSAPVADPARTEVEISWNGYTVSFPFHDFVPGGLHYRAELVFEPLTECSVALTSNIGNCEGSVTIPDSLSIASPNSHDTIPLGQPINCSWTSSTAADFYWFFVNIDGVDSVGNWIPGYVMYDRYLTENSLVIPANLFDIAGAHHYICWIQVRPYAGAMPGGNFNMGGDIDGILIATGPGDYADHVYVGSPISSVSCNKKREVFSYEEHIISVYRESFGH